MRYMIPYFIKSKTSLLRLIISKMLKNGKECALESLRYSIIIPILYKKLKEERLENLLKVTQHKSGSP